MAGSGGAGAARGQGEWLRVYGLVVAMLPRVDALVAGIARLEAVNAVQHEFWEARDALLQHRLLQAEESKRRWEAAYIDLQPSGDDRKFAELQESDFEDLTIFVDVLAAENAEFQIKVKELDAGAEHSQHSADHEHIARYLEAELRKLKQAYEALCSEKDKEVSALIAEKNFVQDHFRTLEKDKADLLSYSRKEAARATEAAKDHEHIARDLKAELRKLKQAYESLRSEKDKEVSALIAEKDFVQDKFRTLEQDKADLLSYSRKEAERATEAAKDHEHTARDLKAELRKLKQAYEALCSEKDKEVSALIAAKDLVRDQFRALEQDTADLLSCSRKEAARAIEAAKELQKNVEQLQVASQKKDDEIHILRAQAKSVEAKRNLVPGGKLKEMYCMPNGTDGEIDKHIGRQPDTSQKCKNDMSERHKKNCFEGPALRGEKKNSSNKMLDEDGRPETSQKCKCATSLSNNDGQNGNDEETRKLVLEPLKKKRVSGKRGGGARGQ